MAIKPNAPITFFPAIEKTIPHDVQRHLQLIYAKLNNHAQAFQRVTDTVTTPIKTAASSGFVGTATGGGGGSGGGGGTITPSGAANEVFATPDGTSGSASLRYLVSGDLPIATTSAHGAVRPDGSSITITGDVISAVGGGSGTPPSGAANEVYATPNGSSGSAALRSLVSTDLPVATASVLGAVRPDGSSITISGGVISAAGGGAIASVGAELTSFGAQSIPNITDTIVLFQTVVKDTGGLSGVVANGLQVPSGAAGWYAITATARWATGCNGYFWLKKNGAFTTGPIGSTQQTTSSENPSQQAVYVTYMNVGDYITVDAFQGSGSAVNITVATLSMALARVPAIPVVVGFVINNGSVGSNVGAMLVAPYSGRVIQCVVITKASDGATALSFAIRQNGVNVFTANPVIAAGTATGTVSTFSLSSSFLSVAAGNVFQIDILTGTASWEFTAQLE